MKERFVFSVFFTKINIFKIFLQLRLFNVNYYRLIFYEFLMNVKSSFPAPRFGVGSSLDFGFINIYK